MAASKPIFLSSYIKTFLFSLNNKKHKKIKDKKKKKKKIPKLKKKKKINLINLGEKQIIIIRIIFF
jgi:hypothetical protein